jgi:hypothetical protein
MEDPLICDALNLTYTELQKQPENWVQKMLILLEGKSKAERLKLQQTQKKRT